MNSSEKMEPKYPFSENDLRHANVSQLKEMCKMNGFKCSGNKSLLMDYLTGRVDGHKKQSSMSNILKRKSTMYTASVKDYLLNHLEPQQPCYTPIDQAKKEQIFGFVGKTSFISGIPCNGQGDHIYGLREGLRAGKDWVGSHSAWNIIPCTHKENVSWKFVYIGNGRKNIVIDDLSAEEIASLNEFDRRKFDALQSYKKYVKSRGAHMYWPHGLDIDAMCREPVDNFLQSLHDAIHALPVIE